jgi:hypothetical protein
LFAFESGTHEFWRAGDCWAEKSFSCALPLSKLGTEIINAIESEAPVSRMGLKLRQGPFARGRGHFRARLSARSQFLAARAPTRTPGYRALSEPRSGRPSSRPLLAPRKTLLPRSSPYLCRNRLLWPAESAARTLATDSLVKALPFRAHAPRVRLFAAIRTQGDGPARSGPAVLAVGRQSSCPAVRRLALRRKSRFTTS